jgi:hypothetical protein
VADELVQQPGVIGARQVPGQHGVPDREGLRAFRAGVIGAITRSVSLARR